MLRRGGNRAHSRIVPVGRRISTLSTRCGSGIDRTEDDSSGSGIDSGLLLHLGPKSKAAPSANHVLQERQTEGKGARAGEGNYYEESDLTKKRRGGGGGGGGGGRRLGMRKGRKTKRFRAGQKFHVGPNFALCEISRTVRNFTHCAKFLAGGCISRRRLLSLHYTLMKYPSQNKTHLQDK